MKKFKSVKDDNVTWKIPLFKIHWDEEDVRMVNEAIRAGMNWATGPNILRFEDLIAQFVGTSYALTFNSGTSALHAMMLAHEIGKGDEVIVPSFTFIATANAPLFVNASPIFADIEEETYGLDPEDVKEKITPRTKAIMPIHYGGCPCKIRELKEIAEDHKLILIEDAAESMGAKINDKKVGTYGDSTMFSLCAPKVITTGEGGIVVTDSRDIYERLKLIRSHGRADTEDYFSSTQYMDYISLGYNFRMSNIIAALGISQLNKIDNIIDLRRKNAKYLTNKLMKNKEIKTPTPLKGFFHIYQMYTIHISNRDKLMSYLKNNGIMTKVYFQPVHTSYFYEKVLKYSCKLRVTEEIAKKVLTLPMYPTLSQLDIEYIVDKIKSFLEEEI